MLEQKPTEATVVDPPRAGVRRSVLGHLGVGPDGVALLVREAGTAVFEQRTLHAERWSEARLEALRTRLEALGTELGVAVYFPELRYATDNGAMIAYAGAQRLAAGEHDGVALDVRPRWSLAELGPPRA